MYQLMTEPSPYSITQTVAQAPASLWHREQKQSLAIRPRRWRGFSCGGRTWERLTWPCLEHCVAIYSPVSSVCPQLRPGRGSRQGIGAVMPSGYHTTLQVGTFVVVPISSQRPWGVTVRIWESLSVMVSLNIEMPHSPDLTDVRAISHQAYLS